MTKNTKIAETLNLPDMEDILKNEEPITDEENQAILDDVISLAEAAEKHLAIIDGDGHAESMDQIHEETLKHAQDFVDLGFNVDQRSAATIFEKAAMMYKTALDAKNSKRDMQLKAMKLFLDKRKLDLEEQRLKFERGEQTVDAESSVMEDRNEIINRIRAERDKKPNP